MTKVVVGAADQGVQSEIRSLLAEIENTEVLTYEQSTSDLSAAVARLKPEVVIVHDRLGPQSAPEVVREIVFRSPASGVVVLNSTGDVEGALKAMEAGAKGVVSYPISFDDLYSRYDAAREWSERMGGLLSGAVADTGRTLGRHGRVTVFAGAKGGVGTTTVATHMALDLHRKVNGLRVCLVDLDLQAGDVSGMLEARQRVSIADVAKVAEDLSAATILDALVRHESGVSLLLTPLQVHETEYVTPGAVRAILGLLRQEFDVILVDGGSHATPAQAAAVEVADAVVTVVTPDVLAMRSFRRTIQAWESLGVSAEQDLHVLVNRVSKEDVLNPDALSRLTSAKVVSTRLPATFRRLERAVNSRDPGEVREAAWWAAIERIGAEVGVNGVPAPAAPERPPARRRAAGRRRAPAEAGQAVLENVALVPLLIAICLLCWQLGLTGLAFVWNGHAANAAARAQAIGADPDEAARQAVPESVRDQVRVTVAGDGTVTVTMQIPALCPGCAALPGHISQTSDVVEEP